MPILNLGLPASDYPDGIDTEGGFCAVVGSGRCVWDDVATLNSSGFGYDVMAVNDMIMHWPGDVAHIYSNDDRQMRHWHIARRDTLPDDIRGFHSREIWPWPGHGTSALGAVYTALALGYDQVYICGCPLDDTGHYFDPPWVGSKHDKENIAHWEKAARDVFEGRVTAMSGRLVDVLR